jgi:copper resistance protein C
MGRLPMIGRAAVVLLMALLGWLAAVPTASAHERLEASEPPADAVLTEVPARIQLTFSGAVGSPTLILRNGSGDEVSEGEPLLDGALVTLPIQPDLPNGAYTVEWRVVSSDGDPVSGSYAFTVEAPVTAAPAPSTATGATSASPSPSDTGPAGVDGGVVDGGVVDGGVVDGGVVDGGEASTGPWLVAGAGMLAVVAGFLAVRRRRSGGSARERPDR